MFNFYSSPSRPIAARIASLELSANLFSSCLLGFASIFEHRFDQRTKFTKSICHLHYLQASLLRLLATITTCQTKEMPLVEENGNLILSSSRCEFSYCYFYFILYNLKNTSTLHIMSLESLVVAKLERQWVRVENITVITTSWVFAYITNFSTKYCTEPNLLAC